MYRPGSAGESETVARLEGGSQAERSAVVSANRREDGWSQDEEDVRLRRRTAPGGRNPSGERAASSWLTGKYELAMEEGSGGMDTVMAEVGKVPGAQAGDCHE